MIIVLSMCICLNFQRISHALIASVIQFHFILCCYLIFMLAHIGSREKKTCKENDTTVNIVNGTRKVHRSLKAIVSIFNIFSHLLSFLLKRSVLFFTCIQYETGVNKINTIKPTTQRVKNVLWIFLLLNLSVENALTYIQNKFSQTMYKLNAKKKNTNCILRHLTFNVNINVMRVGNFQV